MHHEQLAFSWVGGTAQGGWPEHHQRVGRIHTCTWIHGEDPQVQLLHWDNAMESRPKGLHTQ